MVSSAYALVTGCEARHAVGLISWLKTAGGVVHVIRDIVVVILILLHLLLFMRHQVRSTAVISVANGMAVA